VPNKKAQYKHVRQSKRRNLQNRGVKSTLYTNIKKVRKSLETENLEEVKANLPKTLKSLSKSMQKGLVHKRKAARLESRMIKSMNKLAKKQSAKPETT
jgi:small subunit ribosomal protein S20